MNKKLMRIGDRVWFSLWVKRMRRVVRSEGKIICEYPFTEEVDVMDSRGHVWRTDFYGAINA